MLCLYCLLVIQNCYLFPSRCFSKIGKTRKTRSSELQEFKCDACRWTLFKCFIRLTARFTPGIHHLCCGPQSDQSREQIKSWTNTCLMDNVKSLPQISHFHICSASPLCPVLFCFTDLFYSNPLVLMMVVPVTVMQITAVGEFASICPCLVINFSLYYILQWQYYTTSRINLLYIFLPNVISCFTSFCLSQRFLHLS